MSDLQETIRQVEQDAFVERYPGAFLLAMGYLKAEEIKNVAQSRGGAAQDNPTAAFVFSKHMRHEVTSPHPLAGLAFFLRPTGASPSVTIGRSADCGITIPDPSVSDHHCRIEVTPQGVQVVDPGSTNGTCVNLARLEPGEPMVVADQDILSTGRYSFQFLSSRSLYQELKFLAAVEDFD